MTKEKKGLIRVNTALEAILENKLNRVLVLITFCLGHLTRPVEFQTWSRAGEQKLHCVNVASGTHSVEEAAWTVPPDFEVEQT